jgi:hypothetical protein
MKRKARTCPDGCQGSGDFVSLTEDEIERALDELTSFVELPAVDHEAEERSWEAARERMGLRTRERRRGR